MVQSEVKEESVKVETVEHSDSVPESEVTKEAEIDVGKMVGSLSWAPLENEALEAHGEEIVSGIMERIPNLSVRTSPNQHMAISHGDGSKRGRVVAKIWFAKSKVCVETPILEGKAYKVGQSRYLDEKTGLSKKDRTSIIREIKTYIADRGWER